MPAYLAAQNELFVGDGLVLEAPAGEGTYVVVFEDDEETGYFYALDTASTGNPIQTALHIYDVDSVADKDKPSQVKIAWSEDHRKALLLINDYPHAVFDFEARQGPVPYRLPAAHAQRLVANWAAMGRHRAKAFCLMGCKGRCPRGWHQAGAMGSVRLAWSIGPQVPSAQPLPATWSRNSA